VEREAVVAKPQEYKVGPKQLGIEDRGEQPDARGDLGLGMLDLDY